jgi:hypothetical protein
MDFGWDEEEQTFRAKVHGFIQEHWIGSGLQDVPQ